MKNRTRADESGAGRGGQNTVEGDTGKKTRQR